MESIFKKNTKGALHEYISACSKTIEIDANIATNLAANAIKYYGGNKLARLELRLFQELENRWYASLEVGEPDYSVYKEPYYLSDVWACWVVYSRKYLLAISSDKSLATKDDHGNWYNKKSILDDIGKINSVADLGCGLGYTTAALKEMFPDANVYGTNIENSSQYKIATEIGTERNFTVIPEVISETDLVFASEYFEHFQSPVEHLLDVVRIANPKYFIIANAFNSKSLGHFNQYKHGEEFFNGKKISRLFNQTLRKLGYEKVKTKLWNNRPMYWRRITQ